MLVKDYLEGVAGLKADETVMPKLKESLLSLMPQSKFNQLMLEMQNEKDWDQQAIVVTIGNSNVMELATYFRNYEETYVGQEKDYGIKNEIICFVSDKPDTKPGDVLCNYRKNASLKYTYNEDGSHARPAVFHPDHILTWVTKTNNKISGVKEGYYFGKGVKYVVYVYIPSEEVRKNCYLIKEKQKLKDKGVYDKIRAIQTDADEQIAALKKEAGISTIKAK